MELIISNVKQIMEDCKRRARAQGLSFSDETLEFVITNEDMIRLSPKGMIPTMYEYWVNDVFVLQDKGKYDLYPGNPYETVINTRPPISFYNDNNPDWLNVMIFYHVIAHIDFFQNNVFFAKTWLDDFLARARAHAEIIKELRYEKGHWVDYAIEFARGIDNLTDFFSDLNRGNCTEPRTQSQVKVAFFFDEYLQNIQKSTTFKYIEELNRYNEFLEKNDEETARTLFLMNVEQRFLDFDVKFAKRTKVRDRPPADVMEYIMRYSPFLAKDDNGWMKQVIQIVRETSQYFQPQIRTKILNEGWASYWHEKLFLADDRLRTHEIDFSKINAGVVSLPRVGMNPYAIGLRMLKYLEAKADRGMFTYEFDKLEDFEGRKKYDKGLGKGLDYIFEVRRYYCDGQAINEFIDQDFLDTFNLFVTGKRINKQKMVWEYYVKSRKAEDYKKKMLESLYHPPHITVDHERTKSTEALHLVHTFEGKELVKEYVQNTMLGIEYLWGNKVVLETNEVDEESLQKMNQEDMAKIVESDTPVDLKFQKVRYTMEKRKLTREVISPHAAPSLYEDDDV
ncbi:MAG: SpoVR family protein [Candidatus Riflebacteria bacterium]|nr:SpoVR family protein [Candidatus Riflebacteria bacterium]